MSQENVEFLEGLFAGAADMDKQALLDALPDLIPQMCDPDIEWVEDPRRADRRTYHGHEGVFAREEGRGAASGATIGKRIYSVYGFRDGKISRYEEFYEERDALEAAGLRL
jgi:ketosteroid isomerase-like protein